MVTRKAIASLLEDYEDIVVATVCSHSSLQIFHGARQEGFRTLGIAIGQRPRFYDAFPLAKPDEFLIVDSYADILDQADDLVARQAVTVPHGSFVEYMGADVFAKLPIPTFGNREVLRWESDRDKQREWLTSAGVPMPLQIEHPKDIDRPVRRHDWSILSGDNRVGQARVQGLRDLDAHRRRDEPVHRWIPIRRPRRARDVDGPPHREGDPGRPETRTSGGRPQLRRLPPPHPARNHPGKGRGNTFMASPNMRRHLWPTTR